MSFENYEKLLDKVDEKFEEIRGKYPRQFRCGQKCHECCMPGLTVFKVEKEYIRQHIDARPGKFRELADLDGDNPWKGERCRFLDKEGNCSIYEARPLICRSHGAPLSFTAMEKKQTDVCPLNFEKLDLEKLAEGDFINLDTLNTLLVLINRHFSEEESGERFPLRLGDILD